MIDQKHMVIVNEDGQEIEVEIILTFASPDGKKQFVLIADPEDSSTVYPFQYNDDGEMEEVTDPDDFNMCQEVCGAYFAEETEDDA